MPLLPRLTTNGRLHLAMCALSIVGLLTLNQPAIAEQTEAVPGLPEVHPTPLITKWISPPDCIQKEELLKLTENELNTVETHDRSLSVQIEAIENKWHVTFVVDERGVIIGERKLVLESETCRDNDETLTLVAALLLEHGPPPPAEKPAPIKAPPPAPPQPTKKKEIAAITPSQQFEPVRKSGPRFRSTAGLSLLGGWTKGLAIGPSLGIGFLPIEALLLELRGVFFTAPEVSYLDDRAQVKSTAGRVQFRACGRKAWGTLGVFACGGGGWLALGSRGDTEQSSTKAFFSTGELTAELGLEWLVADPLSLSLEGGVSHPLRQGRFLFEVDGEAHVVHETSLLLGLGTAAATLRF